jgi:hypothetical protein
MVHCFKNTMQSNSYLSASQLSALVFSFPALAFSGSRHCSSSASSSAAAFLPSVASFSGSVGVGCARGVDSLVRSAFPSALVFRVSSFLVGGRVVRASFALRSSALVRWLAASSGLLVVFPSSACPVGVVPSASFRGFGSGSWGSAALAVGLGVPVLLFVPASLGSSFPAPQSFRFSLLASCFGGSWWFSA